MTESGATTEEFHDFGLLWLSTWKTWKWCRSIAVPNDVCRRWTLWPARVQRPATACVDPKVWTSRAGNTPAAHTSLRLPCTSAGWSACNYRPTLVRPLIALRIRAEPRRTDGILYALNNSRTGLRFLPWLQSDTGLRSRSCPTTPASIPEEKVFRKKKKQSHCSPRLGLWEMRSSLSHSRARRVASFICPFLVVGLAENRGGLHMPLQRALENYTTMTTI